MGDVRVLPSSVCTPEVLLRWLLERHKEFRSLVIVTYTAEGSSELWQSQGLSKGEQSYAAAKLLDDVMNGPAWGEVEEGEEGECPEPVS